MTQREIKFRAWTGGRMIEWDEYQSDSLAPWKTISIDNFPLIHMQFTGLKDKNGKEIYEGDIVKYLFHGIGKSQYNTGKVMWTNFSFCIEFPPIAGMLQCDNISHHIHDTEVIGNIYENPELLINK